MDSSSWSFAHLFALALKQEEYPSSTAQLPGTMSPSTWRRRWPLPSTCQRLCVLSVRIGLSVFRFRPHSVGV